MRIAVLSDFHFGFGAGSERAGDPYDAFREAIGKAKECDLLVFCGDIFDTRNPDAETLAKAMELMIPPLLTQNDVKLIQGIGKDISSVSEIALMGTPIVAIHGTHERRTKGLLNPVEALEKAGFLAYLHCNGVIFEKDGERVAVQGMSGVPDQYAEGVLSNWNPSPEHGCFNIFVLHQSITEFLYADHTLDLSKLPKGFDLYVNGHIHEAKACEYDRKPFLLTGSLVPTQIRDESAEPKGFWMIETSVRDLAREAPKAKKVADKDGVRIYWLPLENQRKAYYRSFENPDVESVEKEMGKLLGKPHDRKPIVRIELKGKFSDSLAGEIDLKFGGKAILSVKKSAEKDHGQRPGIAPEEHRLSVEEMGRKILLENLAKAKLGQKKFEGLFELLSEGRTDEAINELLKDGGKDGSADRRRNPKQTMLFPNGMKHAKNSTDI